MPFVSRQGAQIHYAIHRENRPAGDRVGADTASSTSHIVLIQGLGLSSTFWFDVPTRLAKENPGRTIITLDNRGTGKSSRPPLRSSLMGNWTVGTMADDVAAVLDVEGIESAIIVGISMGGMIAQHFALRHPSKARGLVLLATSPGFPANTSSEPIALYRLLSIPFGGKRASRNLSRLLLPESKWNRAGEIFRDWPNAMLTDPTPPSTFVAHLLAAMTHYIAPHLEKIECPVIVATGDSDTLIPRKNAETLSRLLRNAELEVLPDTGHALFADDRDVVVRLVKRVEARC